MSFHQVQSCRIEPLSYPRNITLNHTIMAKTGRLQRNDANATSKALLGAAMLHLVPGLLYWPVVGLSFDRSDWIRILGCGLLAVMGLGARWAPLPPAIICCVLYALWLGLQASQGAVSNPIVLILHAGIILLLLVALVAAIKARNNPPATDSSNG